MKDDYFELVMYVMATLKKNFSEVTSLSSTTPSDKDFYTEESTLSSTPTATDQSTLEKHEVTAGSMSTEIVIIGCVGIIVSLIALAFVVKKYSSSCRLSYLPTVID